MAYNKHKNIRAQFDGLKFGSKAELARYHLLKLLERTGEIADLETQVRYDLIPEQIRDDGSKERAVHYIADFVYFDKYKNKTIVEDVKGQKKATPEFILKRKLMLYRRGITVQEIRKK